MNGSIIRVQQDKKKKQKIINYRLLHDSKVVCNRTSIKDISKEFNRYLAKISISEQIQVPQFELQAQNKTQCKVVWLHSNESITNLYNYLSEFYNEKHIFESYFEEEGTTFKEEDYDDYFDIFDDNEQTFISIAMIKSFCGGAPVYNYNKNINEFYIAYNEKSNKEELLNYVVNALNLSNLFINNHTHQELYEHFKENTKLSDVYKFYQEDTYKIKDDNSITIANKHLSKEFIVSEFCKLLKQNKQEVVRISGVKEFGYLDNITIKKQIKLESLLYNYINRHEYLGGKELTNHWKNCNTNWFFEFIKIIDKKHVNEIEKIDINKYQKAIKDCYYNQKPSSFLSAKSKKEIKRNNYVITENFVNKRFASIKTIFKNSLSIEDEISEIDRVLRMLNTLSFVKDDNKVYDPKILEVQQFHTLCNLTEKLCDEELRTKWKLIFLLGLNTASYFKDISDMQIDNIDMEKSSLIMTRSKKRTLKVASLWNITLEMLTKYLSLTPHKSKYIFTTRNGTNYKAQSMRDYFAHKVKILDTKNKLNKLKFNNLRDSAVYAMMHNNINSDIRSMILGHKLDASTQDHYLLRTVELVKSGSEAIYDYYEINKLDL